MPARKPGLYKMSRKEQADFWRRVRAHSEMREMPRDLRLTETNFAVMKKFLALQQEKATQTLREEKMKSHFSHGRSRKKKQ